MRLPSTQPQWKPKKSSGTTTTSSVSAAAAISTAPKGFLTADPRADKAIKKTQYQSPPSAKDDRIDHIDDDDIYNSFDVTDVNDAQSSFFWMKLLEESQDVDEDDSSSFDENNGRRGTMIGHEIEKTWSNGSPLSISSEFNHQEATKAMPPQGGSSNKTSNKEQRSFGDVTNSYHHLNSATTSGGSGPAGSSIKRGTDRSLDRRHRLEINRIGQQARMEASSFSTCKNLLSSNTTSRRKIQRVGPNPVDYDKFRWAYDTWYRAGLMKQQINPTSRSYDRGSDFWPQAHSSRVKNPSLYYEKSSQDDEDSIQAKCMTTDDEMTVDTASSCSPIQKCQLSSKVSSSSSCGVGRNLPEEDIERMPSSDSTEQKGFQRLLSMWRDQGKEKDDVMHLPTTSSQSKTHPNPDCHRGGTDISLISQKMKEQDEKNENSAISGISKEIVPYDSSGNNANEYNAMPSEQTRMVKSESFVGSDVVEHSYYHGTEKSRALIILENDNRTYDLMVGEAQRCVGGQLVVRNLDSLAGNRPGGELGDLSLPCECSQSVFSGNDDLISFFLPQMGMACSCGRQRRGLIKPEDPTAIENVLRPWQCEFLKSFGIHRGEQLVKARHRSADILARALRQWRKKYDMVPFKTSSCGMALHIWAKTCKAYVRSIRKQIEAGNDLLERQPAALVDELSQFLHGLPEAPPKRRTVVSLNIEPESQVEV